MALFKQDFSDILFGDIAEGHESRIRKGSLLLGVYDQELLELAPQ